MNKFVLISTLIIASAMFISLAESKKQSARYKTWKVRFGKKNEDKKTEEARLEVFSKNCELIDRLNEKFLNGTSSFFADLNALSALLPNEFKDITGLFAKPKPKRGINNDRHINRNGGYVFSTFSASPTAPKRTSNDWRTVWKKPVDNQQTCGSCWAFTATAVIDAAYKIKKNMDISTSKQELVDCAGYLGNLGCNGGVQTYAFEYVISKGLSTETAYSNPVYSNRQLTCRKPASPAYKIDGFVEVDANEEALRQAVDQLGVCSVSMDVSDPLFMNYKGGIYRSNGSCKTGPMDVNHAMTLVGYGQDAATRQDFWIIRNSWGPTWGENGHIRVARNAGNTCAVASVASCVLLK